MEKFDNEKGRRVWQRVNGAAPPVRQETKPQGRNYAQLAARELTDAALYQRLARVLPGPEGAVVQALYKQEQAHGTVLRGICVLESGTAPKLAPEVPEEASAEVLLRRCWGRKQQAIAAYDQLAGDSVYGHIFTRLKTQEQEQCVRILELLSRLADRKK